jgi:hypothetical protein
LCLSVDCVQKRPVWHRAEDLYPDQGDWKAMRGCGTAPPWPPAWPWPRGSHPPCQRERKAAHSPWPSQPPHPPGGRAAGLCWMSISRKFLGLAVWTVFNFSLDNASLSLQGRRKAWHRIK